MKVDTEGVRKIMCEIIQRKITDWKIYVHDGRSYEEKSKEQIRKIGPN